jgi:hypothetical protein
MWLRLRQICLVAGELAPAVDDLRAIFGLEVCHVDPGVAVFGLENSLLPVGSQFLEVVSPTEENTAAGRYLERRGGDGGYMVITQCDDHAPRKKRVAELGVRIAFAFDRPDFQGMQLHPRDTGGSFLEIDWSRGGEDPDGPWLPAGPNWRPARRTDVVTAIRAAELQSPDPEKLAGRWSEIVQIPLGRDARGRPQLPLENATLRFVEARDGRGEGLGGVDLATADRARALGAAEERGRRVADDRILVCGTRFRLVDGP